MPSLLPHLNPEQHYVKKLSFTSPNSNDKARQKLWRGIFKEKADHDAQHYRHVGFHAEPPPGLGQVVAPFPDIAVWFWNARALATSGGNGISKRREFIRNACVHDAAVAVEAHFDLEDLLSLRSTLRRTHTVLWSKARDDEGKPTGSAGGAV